MRFLFALISVLSVWGVQAVGARDMGAGMPHGHAQGRADHTHATSPSAGAMASQPRDGDCPYCKYLAHRVTEPASMELRLSPVPLRQHSAQPRAVSFKSFLDAPPTRPPSV